MRHQKQFLALMSVTNHEKTRPVLAVTRSNSVRTPRMFVPYSSTLAPFLKLTIDAVVPMAEIRRRGTIKSTTPSGTPPAPIGVTADDAMIFLYHFVFLDWQLDTLVQASDDPWPKPIVT